RLEDAVAHLQWPVRKKERPVAQIGSMAHVCDAMEEGRARRFKKPLLLIGVELTDGETTASREPAERIGEPVGQAGEIIECEQVAVVGCNHQLAFLARKGPYGGHIGVDQCLEQL